MHLGLAADEAEDLTIEAMAAVWRRAAGFDRHATSAATWIFRIARNLRLDAFRVSR